ncbi:uncharacterized protein UHOD_11470 [Ustilago sp. UG-2017b]|nr:uncharacterized protein UHOD_11470 [Ustilago sp. UG-2017b]
MLDWSIKGREAGAMRSVNRDEVDAKLVGAYAAYARGLTPMHAGATNATEATTTNAEAKTFELLEVTNDIAPD